jgi:hypothetical protein
MSHGSTVWITYLWALNGFNLISFGESLIGNREMTNGPLSWVSYDFEHSLSTKIITLVKFNGLKPSSKHRTLSYWVVDESGLVSAENGSSLARQIRSFYVFGTGRVASLSLSFARSCKNNPTCWMRSSWLSVGGTGSSSWISLNGLWIVASYVWYTVSLLVVFKNYVDFFVMCS